MTHRRRLPAIVAVVAWVLTSCVGTGQDAEPLGPTTTTPTEASSAGDQVPDLAIEAFDGTTVSFTDYAGTPLLVNFWASWCPPCIAEMPDLEAVHQATADQISFVGVNTQDTPEAAARLAESTGVTYDLVRDPDGEVARAFGVFGMPSTFYVDASGTIVGRHTGLLTRDAMFADLDEHLGVVPATDP